MYQTRSPQLTEHADYPLRDEYMEGIHLENNPSHSQYRIFSMSRHNRDQSAPRSEASFSDDLSLTPSTSRSATQDLAEFLKVSSPEDYKRFLGSSSAEDLMSSAISQKRSFRFLGSSTPRSSPSSRPSTTSSTAPLPNKNVVSKTTSRGKPYLQISVDYDESYPQSHTTITATPQAIFSSGTSPEMYQHTSVGTSTSTSTDSVKSPPASCPSERQSKSSFPSQNALDSRISLDAATMGRYQQFLDSGFNSKAPSTAGTKSNSPTDIVSAGMAELRAYQEFQRLQSMKTPPRTPDFSSIPRTSGDPVSRSPRSPRSRRSRPNSTRLAQPKSREASTRSSVASDLFDDITDIEFEGTAGPHNQRKKCRKAPPRPGPPPNRSLPSLPEGHDDPRSSSPGKSRGTLNVRHSQISFASSSGSTSSRLDDAQSIKSDRKSREERVKARKAKDLDRQLKLLKEKKSKGGLGDDSAGMASGNPGPSTCPLSSMDSDSSGANQSDIRRSGSGRRSSSGNSRRGSSADIALSEHPVSSINSLPKKPSTGGSKAPSLCIQSFPSTASLRHDDLQQLPASPASPALSTKAHCCSAREMELEARMLAVERKNKMLEQALMAVIRSAVRGQAQRRTELLKANVLEELLDEVDLDEFPAAFVGGC